MFSPTEPFSQGHGQFGAKCKNMVEGTRETRLIFIKQCGQGRSTLKIDRENDRLTWIPKELDSALRASLKMERQLAVLTGIPVRLTCELEAPLMKRPLCQPVTHPIAHF